jgi:hypothetical protein
MHLQVKAYPKRILAYPPSATLGHDKQQCAVQIHRAILSIGYLDISLRIQFPLNKKVTVKKRMGCLIAYACSQNTKSKQPAPIHDSTLPSEGPVFQLIVRERISLGSLQPPPEITSEG